MYHARKWIPVAGPWRSSYPSLWSQWSRWITLWHCGCTRAVDTCSSCVRWSQWRMLWQCHGTPNAEARNGVLLLKHLFRLTKKIKWKTTQYIYLPVCPVCIVSFSCGVHRKSASGLNRRRQTGLGRRARGARDWECVADSACVMPAYANNVCVCVCVCVYVCMYMYVCTYTLMFMQACVYTHTHIHTHTYICIHIHEHMFVCLFTTW